MTRREVLKSLWISERAEAARAAAGVLRDDARATGAVHRAAAGEGHEGHRAQRALLRLPHHHVDDGTSLAGGTEHQQHHQALPLGAGA